MTTAVPQVLLVEDDPNDILLLERAFGKAQLTAPLQVNDGEEAIAYLAGEGNYADRERHPLPNLVLLDLKLPKKSGLEVLHWLRQQPVLQRLPVVVLTSSREHSDVNRAYELGANSYLVKPVRSQDLVEMIKTLDVYWLWMNEKPDLQ